MKLLFLITFIFAVTFTFGQDPVQDTTVKDTAAVAGQVAAIEIPDTLTLSSFAKNNK